MSDSWYRRALALSFALLGGCSILYETDVPAGCEVDDADGDGFASMACPGGTDCDDTNPNVHPMAEEVCGTPDDGLNEDCNLTTLGPDMDGDGEYPVRCFNVDRASGAVTRGTDCNDMQATVNSGGTEECNDWDDDCDGEFNEGFPELTLLADCDGDGAGDPENFTFDCRNSRADDPPLCEGPFEEPRWVTERDSVRRDCDDEDPMRAAICDECGSIDLLFVLDTSPSMAAQQERLVAKVAGLVNGLATWTPTNEPITDLHVAVVVPDLGAGDGTEFRNDCSPRGEDAGFRNYSGTMSCEPSFPQLTESRDARFLEYNALEPFEPISDFIGDVACLASAGTSECAVEQPLEAALKALTPASSPIRFYAPEGEPEDLGHGDGINRGFLRPDSLLVVVVVTDSDDCSAEDTFFYADGKGTNGPLAVRCAEQADQLRPIGRYVQGLLALRSAEDLIFAVVGGVPSDLLPEPGGPIDYGTMLDDPRMTPGRQGMGSCQIPGDATPRPAHPPRRMVQLARELDETRGASVLLGSICEIGGFANVVQDLQLGLQREQRRRCGSDRP